MNNQTNIEPKNNDLNLVKYETVTRNKERFPKNFCFQLTEDEFSCLRLQIATV